MTTKLRSTGFSSGNFEKVMGFSSLVHAIEITFQPVSGSGNFKKGEGLQLSCAWNRNSICTCRRICLTFWTASRQWTWYGKSRVRRTHGTSGRALRPWYSKPTCNCVQFRFTWNIMQICSINVTEIDIYHLHSLTFWKRYFHQFEKLGPRIDENNISRITSIPCVS